MHQKPLYQQKDFVLLTLGKLVSLLGSNMQQFALSLYVLALTGSATIFASMLSIIIFPRIILSPFAGVFGDWFNRKKSIVFLDLLNALILGTYAILFAFQGGLNLPLIYLLVVLLEITEIFFGAAMTGMIPSIVSKEQLLEANSYNSLVLNIGQLAAPVIAAALYAAFGLQMLLIINSLSFFASALSEMFINVPQTTKKPEVINLRVFQAEFILGLKTIKDNSFLTTIISLGTILNFSISPLFSIGLVFIVKEVLKASDFQFGILQSAFAVSMIVAPLISARFLGKLNIGKICYNSFIITGVLIFLLALIPSKMVLDHFQNSLLPLVLLTAIAFPIGVAVSVANIAINTLFQQTVPLELMGRTATTSGLLITFFIPIGQILFGYLYDKLVASLVILISGGIFFLAVWYFKPALLTAGERAGQPRAEVNRSEI